MTLFRTIGDRIEYEGRSVAVFLHGLVPTFRDRVEDTLACAAPNMVSEQTHADALRTQEKEFEDEILRLETERDDAKEEAGKWLRELEAIDDDTEGGAGGRIATLVEENTALTEAVKHWRQLFERSQETVRQMQYEAKYRKSSKNRPLDRRRAHVAD